MYGYIYKFTNLTNGKVYIGKHKYSKPTLDENYLTSGVLINRSINKHGLDNFKQEIVCCCDTLNELNEAEIHYIKYFNCMYPNGYNLTKGGDGVSEPTPDIIERNRLWHKGRKQSEESNIKRSNALKGRPHNKEWIQKIKEANKGQVIAQVTKDASSKRHKGTHWYNDGTNEYMLFDEDVKEGMVKGRLKIPLPIR